MTDRTASRSDARKRRASETVSHLISDLPPVPTPTLRPGDRVAVHCGDDTYTFTVPLSDQEPDMTDQNRHDELVALLTEIRDRLPKPEGVNAVEDEPACDCGAADGYHAPDCPRAPFPPEPAPADDGLVEWERELLRNADTFEEWRAEPDEALAEAEGRIADLECRAKRAESDLADMTRLWGALGRMADHNHDVAAKVKAERDEWKARYKALRGDVEREGWRATSEITKAVCSRILVRDTERGQS